MSMLRMNNRAAIRATLRPQITAPQNDDQRSKTVAVVGIDALDNEELGGAIVKVMKFRVTCGIKNNIISFFAQLKGGKSFGVTPVMPKDPYGNPLVPDTVANSAEGYLVLKISENSKVEVKEGGRMEFSIRPNFVAFEKTMEEAEAAKVTEEKVIEAEAKAEADAKAKSAK